MANGAEIKLGTGFILYSMPIIVLHDRENVNVHVTKLYKGIEFISTTLFRAFVTFTQNYLKSCLPKPLTTSLVKMRR